MSRDETYVCQHQGRRSYVNAVGFHLIVARTKASSQDTPPGPYYYVVMGNRNRCIGWMTMLSGGRCGCQPLTRRALSNARYTRQNDLAFQTDPAQHPSKNRGRVSDSITPPLSKHQNKRELRRQYQMASITVASKANGGVVLPALLAATYFSQCRPDSAISIEYIDAESHGRENAKAVLTTDDGKSLVDESVIKHLLEKIQLPRGMWKSGVCLAHLPKLLPVISHRFLDCRMAGSLCRPCSP